jgi:hypothetical protein
MVDGEFENYINADKPLLTFGKNLVLIEMSYVAASSNIEQVIFQLRIKGLQPVLAHPERYNYYLGTPDQYDRFHGPWMSFANKHSFAARVTTASPLKAPHKTC